jgi:hypothetical protein
MSKKPIKPEDRKIKFSVTINPLLFSKIDDLGINKSKYVETLIKTDLIKRKIINKTSDNEKM